MEVGAVTDINSLEATELRLGLPGTDEISRGSKRALPADTSEESPPVSSAGSSESNEEIATPQSVPKAQVVGWPPVQSFRRRNSFKAKKEAESGGGGLYVKVSMDGAPYLRKVDLNVYKGYKDLREALEELFKCFSLGDLSGMEGCEGVEYVVAYEDKDGDWMLVGDVPWEMFISTCKRLRIMKGSEAMGLGTSS